MNWFSLDWSKMFIPSQPILETLIRGSCIYLALYFLLRLFRRQKGSMAAADLLVLLLIADASQNGMAGEYKSITDGVLLVATIVFWEYAVDWLGFHSKSFRKLFEPAPLELVRNGRIEHQNLEAELITLDELMSQLRQKGVNDPREVIVSYLESDGHISVVTADSNPKSMSSRDDVH